MGRRWGKGKTTYEHSYSCTLTTNADCTASVKYCADGGANRLYARYGPRRRASRDEDNSGDAGYDAFLPDEIRGDLDSLKPHVRDYYKSKVRLLDPL